MSINLKKIMETKTIIECLELQITELEMLASMYPKQEEFSIMDPSAIAHVHNYISGISKVVPKHLNYTLHLEIADVQDKLELHVSLPHDYPDTTPDVHARSSALKRNEQNELNNAIDDFLISPHCKGELCIISLVTWLTENASKYFSQEFDKKAVKGPVSVTENGCKNSFSRLWIYSHHIYNKDKRKDILAMGKNLDLSGFCLPGKPGVICVEGFSTDCDNFFQSIKQMNWKKLSLCHSEIIELDRKHIDKSRYFEPFQEISFQVRKGPAREYHMDMGEFHKYLESHNCSYAFELIFGFEGHSLSELS